MKDKKLLECVKKAANGNKKAFIELCNLKAREIIYLCVVQMKNQHDGEDAAQEVFIRMQQGITKLKAPEAFNVWLNRLVHNTCFNMKRNSMKYKDALTTDGAMEQSWQEESRFLLPQAYAEDAEMRKAIADVIQDLPDKYRETVILHYYQSMSYKEVAEVLGVSLNTVNNNMRMARKYLKIGLEDWFGQPEQSKQNWSAMPMMAAGPILTISLQESAAAGITPAVISKCLAGANIPVHTVGQVAKSSMVKALSAVAAVGVAVGVGVYALSNQQPQAPIPAQVDLPAVVEEAAQQTAAPIQLAPSSALVGGMVSVVGEGSQKGGVEGASLSLLEPDSGAVLYQEYTQQDGSFQFSDVPLDEYSLQLVMPGSENAVNVSVGEGTSFRITEENYNAYGELEITIDLSTSIKGHISLHLDNVNLAYDETYLPGVNIQLFDPEGDMVAETLVHADGTYHFENPLITQAGVYLLRVTVDETLLGENIEIQDSEIELYPGYRN